MQANNSPARFSPKVQEQAPVDKIFEVSTEICKQCGGLLTRVIRDIRPATDSERHYLGYYTLSSYLHCFVCVPKPRYRPVVPSAIWCHPQKRKKRTRKTIAVAPGDVQTVALPITP